MKRKEFRLDDKTIEILKQEKKHHKHSTISTTLRFLISENPKLRIEIKDLNDRLESYRKKLFDIINEQEIPETKELKEIPCNFRIAYDGQYYCAKKAPRTIKLISLDVCKACKLNKWKIPSTPTSKSIVVQRTKKGKSVYEGKRSDIFCAYKQQYYASEIDLPCHHNIKCGNKKCPYFK